MKGKINFSEFLLLFSNVGSDFDENNNESNVFSEAAEDVYTTDFIGSGLKKLRSNSWESLVRWEKENELLHAFIEDECEWLAELFPEVSKGNMFWSLQKFLTFYFRQF